MDHDLRLVDETGFDTLLEQAQEDFRWLYAFQACGLLLLVLELIAR